MKYAEGEATRALIKSSPARGTWIEMILSAQKSNADKSSPARGTWIEINGDVVQFQYASSSPARGTWIEMMLLTADRTVPVLPAV